MLVHFLTLWVTRHDSALKRQLRIPANVITNIVKEREALRESQEIFRHFMENSLVYIFFKDKDIRSINLSRNYEKMLGMPVGNILGKTMNEVFPPDLAASMTEDDPVSFKFLETILGGPSVNILRTENGNDTVKTVRENPEISIVLMYIKMPGMNGLEATAEIRKFNARIPIIAQTAHAFAEDKKLALAAGCNEYLSKPIRFNELVEVINRYISGKII